MACYRGLDASAHWATADASEPLVGTEVQVGGGEAVEEILEDRGKGPHALSSFAFPPRSERGPTARAIAEGASPAAPEPEGGSAMVGEDPAAAVCRSVGGTRGPIITISPRTTCALSRRKKTPPGPPAA